MFVYDLNIVLSDLHYFKYLDRWEAQGVKKLIDAGKMVNQKNNANICFLDAQSVM